MTMQETSPDAYELLKVTPYLDVEGRYLLLQYANAKGFVYVSPDREGLDQLFDSAVTGWDKAILSHAIEEADAAGTVFYANEEYQQVAPPIKALSF